MAAVGKLWGKREDTKHMPVRGLYMWGGVGRGKTWLMDLFYQSLPGERKQRLHFHRFMLRVHDELTELQGQSDPLEIIADRFKAETDVLCFDEFFVSDITDCHATWRSDESPVRPRYYPGSDVKYSAGRTLSKWPATCAFFACNRCH